MVLSFVVLSCFLLSSLAFSFSLVLSCLVVSCLVLSCLLFPLSWGSCGVIFGRLEGALGSFLVVLRVVLGLLGWS